MVDELVDDDAFLDLSSSVIRILVIIQQMSLELENLLRMSSALQYRYTTPYSILPTNSSLDCSTYFEPIIDQAPLASARAGNAQHYAPDFDDCFEPVALR